MCPIVRFILPPFRREFVCVQLREEQLFIDTMLTINTEAFRLQQEEGADIGYVDLFFTLRAFRCT